jgi:CRP-like cAMP-binding protein
MENYKKIFGELSELVWFKKKEIILEEGQIENYISYTIQGSVVYLINCQGMEICKGFSIDNSYSTSYHSFLKRTPSDFRTQALEDTLVERIHYDHIQKAYALSDEAQRHGRLMAESLYIEESKRVISLISQSAEERYNDLVQNKPQLAQRVPQKYLASYLGITPVSLSRLRNKIAKS